MTLIRREWRLHWIITLFQGLFHLPFKNFLCKETWYDRKEPYAIDMCVNITYSYVHSHSKLSFHSSTSLFCYSKYAIWTSRYSFLFQIHKFNSSCPGIWKRFWTDLSGAERGQFIYIIMFHINGIKYLLIKTFIVINILMKLIFVKHLDWKGLSLGKFLSKTI